MIYLHPGSMINHYQINEQIGSGGFAITYRVTDHRDGQVKVLKVLHSKHAENPKTLEWFQQEAKLLQSINDPGVPSIDLADGYFTAEVPRGDKLIHCFVMQWINGINLNEWMGKQSNRSIDQQRALCWLKELVKILHVVHCCNFFHRDIKPSNILVRYEDNNLVLIDFGIAREESLTYHEKREREQDVTNVGSPLYKAPEVEQGKACKQSDFFSLGRTFLFLTAGEKINEFSKGEQTNLNWHDSAPQLSSEFKELLDRLMAPDPKARPSDTQVLLKEIEQLCLKSLPNENETSVPVAHQVLAQSVTTVIPEALEQLDSELTEEKTFRKSLFTVVTTLLAGVISSTLLISGVRSTGGLQSVELHIFDQMMRLRSTKKIQDEHILIVANTKEDIDRYKHQSRSGGPHSSISDAPLLKLLEIVNKSKASVIGLDIIWSFPTKNAALKKAFRETIKLYGVCEIADPPQNDGFEGPKDMSNRIGFANTLEDPDDGRTVRRQLLVRRTLPTGCQEQHAFALRIAFEYLNQQKIPLPKEGICEVQKLGQTYLHLLQSPTGFYQSDLGTKCQILLNPHSDRAPNQNFEIVTLSQMLSGEVPKERIEGKIVLIGTTAPQYGDVVWTLSGQSDEEVAGLFVQAEMVSQLVDIGLGKRLSLKFWAMWQDILWVAGWALLGSIVSLRSRSCVSLLTFGGLVVCLLAITSQLLLELSILVAIVPAVLAATLSGGVGSLVYRKLSPRNVVSNSSSHIV